MSHIIFLHRKHNELLSGTLVKNVIEDMNYKIYLIIYYLIVHDNILISCLIYIIYIAYIKHEIFR